MYELASYERNVMSAEDLDGFPCLHLVMDNWCVRTHKNVLHLLAICLDKLKAEGHTDALIHLPNDPLSVKWGNSLGFDVLQETPEFVQMHQEIN